MSLSLRSLALAAVLATLGGSAAWAADPASNSVRRLPPVEDQDRPSSRRVKSTVEADPAVRRASARQEVRATSSRQAEDAPPVPLGLEYTPGGHGHVGHEMAPMPVAIPAGCGPCASGHGKHHGAGKYQGPSLAERVRYKWNSYWKPGLQESHWGYPEEFCDRPLGYFVHAHAKTQVANGEAARMTLFNYDFKENDHELSLRGQQQLAKIAYMMPRNFFPLVIQATPDDPELALKRRQYVLEALAAADFPIPAERVVVSAPSAYGREGYEAEPEHGLMLQILTNGGIRGPFQTVDQEITTVGQ